MNEKIIKQDSLLSNISNITVKIDHNRKDGSGLFNNFIKSNDNEVQVPFDVLDDYESINNGSLLDKILVKTKEIQDVKVYDHVWVTGNQAAGCSEEQDSSQQVLEQTQKLQKHEELQQLPQQEDSEQSSRMNEAKRQKLMLEKRLKNQTKNIPKNYGKAIISFIQKYEDKVRQVTSKNGVQYEDFLEELKEKKKVINTIADLRSMWVDYRHAKCIRLLSNLFLRKYALNYIFNSRICNYSSHIKYRHRLCEAIKEPFSFKHIKDY